MLYCSELRNIEPFFSLDKVCDKLIPPHMAIQCTEVISPITNNAPYPISLSASFPGARRFRIPKRCKRKNITATIEISHTARIMFSFFDVF